MYILYICIFISDDLARLQRYFSTAVRFNCNSLASGELARLLREPFLHGMGRRYGHRAGRSRVYFSFEQTFRHSQTRFCETDWAARVRPTRGSRSHESSANNRRRNRATGLPSFYSSECFVFSLSRDVTDPISCTPAGTFVFVNPVEPTIPPPQVCIADMPPLYIPHIADPRVNNG